VVAGHIQKVLKGEQLRLKRWYKVAMIKLTLDKIMFDEIILALILLIDELVDATKVCAIKTSTCNNLV
jgi:hypothetical protein